MSKLIRLALIIFILVAGAIILSSGSGKYPRPTNEYYVNDFADALLPGTKYSIVVEGERLYELTEAEPEGGAQIVFATFLVESMDEIAEYNKTELFRQWRIGKNDMGVLVILFFMEETDQDITYLELVGSQIEPGNRMEQYLTPGMTGRLLDETLWNETWEDDIDMGVGNLLYELLTVIYVDAYGYLSFNYDMDDYADVLDLYYEDYETDPVSMNLFMYLISPYSSVGNKILAVVIFVILGGFGGGVLVRNRGGGGSSGGMGISRRRR